MFKSLYKRSRDLITKASLAVKWHEQDVWRQTLSTWGVSLALHVVMLVSLALIVYASTRNDDRRWMDQKIIGQLHDDVTSLFPSDTAGDPFTHMQSSEPLSIGRDTNSNETHVADMGETALGSDFRLKAPVAPSLTLTPSNSTGGSPGKGLNSTDIDALEKSIGKGTAKAAKGAGKAKAKGRGRVGLTTVMDEDGFGNGQAGMGTELNVITGPTVPFSGRSGELKAKLVRSQGGTLESEAAVELGLDWLARHQKPDGSWSLDITDECSGHGCPARPAAVSDTAATGLCYCRCSEPATRTPRKIDISKPFAKVWPGSNRTSRPTERSSSAVCETLECTATRSQPSL